MADFVELFIDAGSNYSTVITVSESNGQAKNLVSYNVSSQMRKSYYSSNAINFDIDIIDPINGLIRMDLAAEVTSNVRPGRYVYDVEIESSTGVVSRIFEGIATVSPNVTRN